MAAGALPAPPETVCVQGTLADASGQALTGARVWRVQFHDASTSGTALGLPLTGTTTVAASGRFSIALTPPVEVVAAPGEVWYELAVDSAATPDDTIDQEDVFPVRVQVHCVLFAQRSVHADRATTATNVVNVPAHSHDALYAAILHNHNGVYALIGHSHDLQDLGGAVTDALLRGEDLAIAPDSTATILLDQGALTTAYPILRFSRGAGAEIKLIYAESLYIDEEVEGRGRRSRAHNKGDRNVVEGKYIKGNYDTITADGGAERRVEPLWWRTFHYVQLEVTTRDEALTLHELSSTFTGYPLEEKAAFKSDAPVLDDIWEVAWRT